MTASIAVRVVSIAVALGLAGCQCVPTLGVKPKAKPPVIAVPPPPAARVAPPAPKSLPVPPAQVARSCVPRGLAAAPRYPDSDAALRNAAGAADRYQLMAAGRLLRERRLQELERVIAGCR